MTDDRDDAELLTAGTLAAYLVRRGLADQGAEIGARELGGGVSNVVLAATARDGRIVVKQALARLRVRDEWLADRTRALREADALRIAGRLVPGSVPAVLDVDPEACAIAIERAPEGWRNWKDDLLAGHADPATATRLGELLAAWHVGTAGDPEVARELADGGAFEQLRVDPYYRTASTRRPELAAAFSAVIARMAETRTCLVHGDYSPKNVLVGDGVWVLDFEVAHYGDSAFDVAFMLNHLLLKRIHVPTAGAALERCAHDFMAAYRAGLPASLQPDEAHVVAHLGCLMVSRVDGKSPAEYLDDAGRTVARATGSRLLVAPVDTVAEAIERVRAAVPA